VSGLSHLADPLPPQASTAGGHRLRLLSYNIQVGISSSRPHHYVTNSWKHLLRSRCRFDNLDRVAHLVSGYDIVALQEADAGSRRTGYVNLTEYIAERAGFPFWHHQLNRNLGRIAQHGSGLLSRYAPSEVIEHRLPGLIPGRGMLMARYGDRKHPLVVILIHLALSRRARLQQLAYVADVVAQYEHVVVMGDMNCKPCSPEMGYLFRQTRLREPVEELHTFPSWRPNHNIDHILVTPSLEVNRCHVVNHALSDHLPIAMEVAIPEQVRLPA